MAKLDTKAESQNNLRSPKEFEFTTNDFKRISALIYARAGITLADSKQEMVYSRVARRLRAKGLTSFETYLSRLESGRIDDDEWEAFTNALTTNLTSFFREAQHFPILAEHAKNKKGNDPFLVWCSASSTGEEPYSIAMTLCEAFGTLNPPARIIATDIDTNVLATAEMGVYPKDKLEKMSSDRIKRFFMNGKGKNEGMVRIRPELRDMITFRQVNLLGDNWQIRGPLDVIFCRNVMIYFDKQTQGKILARFAPLMKPDALLFAGHSENFMYVTNAFKLVGKTVYKLNNGAVASATRPIAGTSTHS